MLNYYLTKKNNLNIYDKLIAYILNKFIDIIKTRKLFNHSFEIYLTKIKSPRIKNKFIENMIN